MTTDTVDMVRSSLAPEPQLIVEKLARLDQISADVQASFPYVQDVHGQRGFSSFSRRGNGALSPRAMDLRLQRYAAQCANHRAAHERYERALPAV